ncbi:MAG: aldehyde dehydrogenase family protein, partial [Flavobacteriales bacterium]|nr:aldehyde dehydrogenase family protein [Flavobacteriales bacterium]
MDIINPSNGTLIETLADHDSDTIRDAFEKLKEGQLNWVRRSIDDRIACIETFNALLLENIAELSAILTSEVGKPLGQSKGEISGARQRIDYFIKNSKRVLADRDVISEGNLTERVTFEPLGVIANISAWNYPYLVGVNVFIPALIAGNAVLYKPSEFSSLTGLEIEKLMQESGISDEVFKCVTGTGDVGEVMLDLPFDGYFFTGSHRTGQYIYSRVAKKMVPCQMELGGKDPLYVSHHNSDVSSVAKAAAEGAFYNNGQSCCAVERIYVHEAVYEEFHKAFLEEVKSFKIGSPQDEDIFIGPLTRRDQLDVLKNQVDDAVRKGAKLELGGKAIDGKGYYFEPTVLSKVNHTMLVMTEESFGPIIGIQTVPNHEAALKLMALTDYGLSASIYSENKEEFEYMARQLNTGTVHWNCCDRVSAHVPWSGRKRSGI